MRSCIPECAKRARPDRIRSRHVRPPSGDGLRSRANRDSREWIDPTGRVSRKGAEVSSGGFHVDSRAGECRCPPTLRGPIQELWTPAPRSAGSAAVGAEPGRSDPRGESSSTKPSLLSPCDGPAPSARAPECDPQTGERDGGGPSTGSGGKASEESAPRPDPRGEEAVEGRRHAVPRHPWRGPGGERVDFQGLRVLDWRSMRMTFAIIGFLAWFAGSGPAPCLRLVRGDGVAAEGTVTCHCCCASADCACCAPHDTRQERDEDERGVSPGTSACSCSPESLPLPAERAGTSSPVASGLPLRTDAYVTTPCDDPSPAPRARDGDPIPPHGGAPPPPPARAPPRSV